MIVTLLFGKLAHPNRPLSGTPSLTTPELIPNNECFYIVERAELFGRPSDPSETKG
jgi:hypothetical protein